jgi:hypothetical protein
MLEFPFGVLPWPETATGLNWHVKTLADFEQTREQWRSTGSDRNWVHPPVQHTERGEYDAAAGDYRYLPVPGSERSAPVWKVPPTHSLFCSTASDDSRDAHRGLATFLLYVIGTVHGVEVQHADWKVVGRQSKDVNGFLLPVRHSLSQLLRHCEEWYGMQLEPVRTTATSAFYLHNHVPSYEFGWEEFAWQYSVFDACWFLALKGGLVVDPGGHAKRIEAFASAMGMVVDTVRFAQWAKFRNDLIHQAMWGDAIPGHQPIEEVYTASHYLRNFVTLGLLGSLGFNSPSLTIDWRARDRSGLEPVP